MCTGEHYYTVVAVMGKAGGGRAYDPPVQDFRKKTGRFNAKVGKKENKATENMAIAKKQEFPWQQVTLSMVIFGVVCAMLYTYLNYVLNDDDDEFDGATTPKS